MRMVMIIFVLLLMIAGATISALKWLEIGPFAPEPEVVETPVEDLPPQYIDLQPLIIPLLQENGVAATVEISVKLEALGKENAAIVKKNLPRIKDAFLKDMYSFLPRLLKDQERLDAFVLKRRFELIARRAVEPNGVINGVLIQSVTDQPGG
jgi:hypothetical protein